LHFTRYAECMKGIFRVMAAAAFTAAFVSAHAAVEPMTITPAAVVAGSPELIHVEEPASAKLDGEWLGQKLQFFRGENQNGWFALAGVDVDAAPGPSTLAIHARLAGGEDRDLSRTVTILPAHYRTAELSVAPRFIEPDPEELKQIEFEIALKKKVFAESAPRPLWSGDFRAPVRATATASFGTRRTFNGKLASVHKGMDFRARMGTPVHASNSGVVILAEKLYFEGNCVVIDHGLGLYTIAMHLSKIDVHDGEHVAKGQLLGLSGATGRVTGPHLHWAVRWGDAYLDPGKMLRMNLMRVR
jgi:murein DD-endopeptidase MepM/ murein hydrolase activator NlpD